MSKPLIATNIITGFLGVGKTTAITHLLKTKPEDEVWSVLVNEFGEIGIDGALLQGNNAHVREVPGGCMCCVAGLPMKIALNMLIARTRPDRILIEPTGLGHPQEIISTLTQEPYNNLLDLRATITLVDPRKLSDARYRDNANFVDQIAVADVLIANKCDASSEQDINAFYAMAEQAQPAKAAVLAVNQGQLPLACLQAARSARQVQYPQHHREQKNAGANRLMPNSGFYNSAVALAEGEDFTCRENKSGGFYSCGWLFSPTTLFDYDALFSWASGLDALRVKAVMRTNNGVYLFNAEEGVLSINPLPDSIEQDIVDSRLEIIAQAPLLKEALQRELLAMRQ